jgi:hypothetical protein
MNSSGFTKQLCLPMPDGSAEAMVDEDVNVQTLDIGTQAI